MRKQKRHNSRSVCLSVHSSSSKLPFMDFATKRRFIHYVAKCFVEDKLKREDIAIKLKEWLSVHLNYKSSHTVHPVTVTRFLRDAVKYGFLQLVPLTSEDLKNKVEMAFHLCATPVKVTVAPDQVETLRCLWFDLVDYLSTSVKSQNTEKIVVGVSGGHTMLAFARAARDFKSLQWDKVPDNLRKKIIVCSLTSGGIRSDFEAVSDIVASTIATFLDSKVSGLLGPAWFSDKKSLEAFKDDQDVKNHVKMAEEVAIIVTSFGYLDDPNSLLSKLLVHEDCSEFIKQNPYAADILYNCYDGQTGVPVMLPDKASDVLFTTMDIPKLRERIKSNATKCFVVATGYNKGRIGLPGILRNQLVSHLYIDNSCAEGLLHNHGYPHNTISNRNNSFDKAK